MSIVSDRRGNPKPWAVYAAAIALTELVGLLAGLLTREGSEYYSAYVTKPALSPPAIVFPIAWGILYALMAVGAARVFLAEESRAQTVGLRLYLLQLGFNFLWTILFFNLRAYGLAFFWLLALLGLVIAMALNFRGADKPAAALQIPYLLWLLFAACLNLGVWTLN